MGETYMRVRINSLSLVGTERVIALRPGLNVITGPITTGKTTLLRLCRFLLGSRSASFPPEVRAAVNAVGGELVIGDDEFSVVRTLASSPSAMVEIAGEHEALRLPSYRTASADVESYGDWLLSKLQLPILQVPSAPTRPESDPTPISINDYFLYCDLNQEEINNSVFGHRDSFKNIKRRYVFEVVYGSYGIEAARLHEELRDVIRNMRARSADQAVLERLLVDTPWGNRAELQRSLSEARAEEQRAGEALQQVPQEALDPEAQRLKRDVQIKDEELASLKMKLEQERTAVVRLTELAQQLETQSTRLTRAIVADSMLLDYEFVVCPRCATSIEAERGSAEICRLCLQEPSPSVTKEDLINEQQRLSDQIAETKELVVLHDESIDNLEQRLQDLAGERMGAASELNLKTNSYISDNGAEMVRVSEDRVRSQELVARLADYMELFARFDRAGLELQALQEQKEKLEHQLEEQQRQDVAFEERFSFLSSAFVSTLSGFNPPEFGPIEESYVDRVTYLPVLYGRRFDELSSQGLKLLVNVAHALAHQKTSLELSLPLPNILFIDGLTTHIGHKEGLDRERVQAVYAELISLSERLGDDLQIVVADLDVPDEARDYVVAAFTEDDRLVP